MGDSRKLLLIVRECLILLLSGIDDYLGMDRTILSRAERRTLHRAEGVRVRE